MIDTGLLASDQEFITGLEALYIRGPFSVQAEYGWNWVNNVTGVVAGSITAPDLAPIRRSPELRLQRRISQVAYTLTGENRAYDKRLGTLAREYFGHPGPYEKAFLVRDENGRLCWGMGAWELAARYSLP